MMVRDNKDNQITCKKNTPFISVIVPVYNTEKYVRQCIESVLTQDFSKFELVLVDDGSKDHSGDICEEYATEDSRVIVVHKKNEGPTAARRTGAEISSGLYVMFLDSDDYLKQGLLKHIHEILREYRAEAMIFNGIRFDENGYKNKYECLLEKGIYSGESIEKIRQSLILDQKGRMAICYGVCMKVFLRTLYVNFQESVPGGLYKGEDLAVTAPLLSSCKSVFVSNVYGYYYRDTPGSLMNSIHSDELAQIKLLADYLAGKMGSSYESRIDAYVVMHLFDYLDRIIAKNAGYGIYREETRSICNKAFLKRIKRAKSNSVRFNDRLVFVLMRYQMFNIIWILRKIKKRK